MTDWNAHYRRVRTSHKMDRQEVVECCRLGGMEISVSRAEGWARGIGDTRRHVRMTAEDFDAFTGGLVDWARKAYRDTD